MKLSTRTDQIKIEPIDSDEFNALEKAVPSMTAAEAREAVLWLRGYIEAMEEQVEEGNKFAEAVLCAVAAQGGCLVAPAEALVDLQLIHAMKRKGGASLAYGTQKDGNVHIHARLERVARSDA
jgi:hypothetical protein